jgi:spore germination protein YaaH
VVSTRKQKQALIAADDPLKDAGILKVFGFLPGHYLFVGAVCKEWQGLYVGTADRQFKAQSVWDTLTSKTCEFKTTLCSAAVVTSYS